MDSLYFLVLFCKRQRQSVCSVVFFWHMVRGYITPRVLSSKAVSAAFAPSPMAIIICL